MVLGNARLSRRSFTVSAATTAAAAAVGSTAVAAPAKATSSAFLPADAQLHLLRRATYGPTPASTAEIRRLGAARWLDRQLRPATIADPVADALIARLPLAGVSIAEVRRRVAARQLERSSYEPMWQLGRAAVARAIWSERQLFEVMVDFWSNHLNVTCPSGDVWDSRADYDRTVIRRFALGRYADMLKASAQHPAMLTYLDNRFSTKASPNENYGRELLELHTVGLSYTEADVRAAARLLTGFTVHKTSGLFQYDPAIHATGPVSAVGFNHPNATAAGGYRAGLAFLDHLAMRPATAIRIATKLCLRFVSDTPVPSLVTKLAKIYLAQGTKIAPVLRALFTSSEFAAAVGSKVRTPHEDVAATVRTLGFAAEQSDAATNPSGTKGLEALHWTLVTAGHAPMGWSAPNGYPDTAEAWASPSGHVIRWNAHFNIATGSWPSQLGRPRDLISSLIGHRPATYGELIDRLARRLIGQPLRANQRDALASRYGKAPDSALGASDEVLTTDADDLIAMILSTPNFALR